MAFWKPGSAQPGKTPPKAIETIGRNSSSSEKVVLSKSVMGMKFMRKKEESIQYEKEEKIKLDKLHNQDWIGDVGTDNNAICADTDLLGELNYIIDTTDTFCALPGRRSFGGFNKAVEKHYQQMTDHARFQKAASKDSKISDEEMLLQYEKLSSLPRGPNQGVRQEVKPASRMEYNRFNAQNKSNDGLSATNNVNKPQHMGATMEEVIVSYEDRTASGNNVKIKRKDFDKGSAANMHQKKKFKR